MGHRPLLGDKSKISQLLLNNVENISFERQDLLKDHCKMAYGMV